MVCSSQMQVNCLWITSVCQACRNLALYCNSDTTSVLQSLITGFETTVGLKINYFQARLKEYSTENFKL